MSEEITGVEEPQGIEVIEDPGEFTLEVTDEIQDKDEEKLKLEAEVAELKAALEKKTPEAEAKPDTAALIAEELKRLASQKEEVKPEETKPQVDFKALMEEVDKNFYNSPSQSIVSMITPIVETVDKKYSSVFTQQSLNIAKLKVMSDDSLKNDYVKYRDEVEAIVKSSPPSETVYEEAVKRVKANHLDDIIAEQVSAKIAELTAQAEKNLGVQATPAPAPQFTNATQVAQAQKKNVVRITPQQKQAAERWALTKGYDWNDPADREWVVKYLKDKGAI